VTRRTAIDVSDLPGVAFDTQAPQWWGNFLMMLIETMTVSLLIATYFYTAQRYEQWPPPLVHDVVTIKRPLPDPTIGTWLVGLLVIATIPMIWADKAAHKVRKLPVLIGLSLASAAGIAAIVLRFYEFPQLLFRWDENAYGSVVWGLLVLHLIYIILEVGEAAIDVIWISLHDFDEKLAVDVTLSTEYWYWTVAVALVIYVVIYWAPRWM
jgi:heme/copper-type cytochrome/quinol oxidase subunit 3